MKKIFLSTALLSTLLLSSCTTEAPQTAQSTDEITDSLQITDPEHWAAQNHKLELKADRGVMANPLELDKFIQIAIIVEDIEAAAREWAEISTSEIRNLRDLRDDTLVS